MEVPDITVDDAERCLKTMLTRAGVNPAEPDAWKIWTVFKAFAQVPVTCADDDLLVECGMSLDESGPFHLNFTRQFVVEEGDAYDHMEQLTCQFTYARHQELESLHLSLWSAGFTTRTEYFAHIESLPAFHVPISQYIPTNFEIVQDMV